VATTLGSLTTPTQTATSAGIATVTATMRRVRRLRGATAGIGTVTGAFLPPHPSGGFRLTVLTSHPQLGVTLSTPTLTAVSRGESG
jgi:hypothetical protein